VAKLTNFDEEKLIKGLDKLKQATEENDREKIISALKELVPSYKIQRV